jgi:hypothetical protein
MLGTIIWYVLIMSIYQDAQSCYWSAEGKQPPPHPRYPFKLLLPCQKVI